MKTVQNKSSTLRQGITPAPKWRTPNPAASGRGIRKVLDKPFTFQQGANSRPKGSFGASLLSPQAVEHSGKAGGKVLIIEDEKPMARALELKLAHAGFDAVSVPDGEKGIAYLEKGKADLILLDLIMPKRDGFSVLETLQQKGIKTPVIVLTNLSQAEDEKRARVLGAKEFFIKSDTPIADIVDRVTKFLK